MLKLAPAAQEISGSCPELQPTGFFLAEEIAGLGVWGDSQGQHLVVGGFREGGLSAGVSQSEVDGVESV